MYLNANGQSPFARRVSIYLLRSIFGTFRSPRSFLLIFQLLAKSRDILVALVADVESTSIAEWYKFAEHGLRRIREAAPGVLVTETAANGSLHTSQLHMLALVYVQWHQREARWL